MSEAENVINIIKADNPEAYKSAMHIRMKVFVEEQGVPEAEECDAYESASVHYLATVGKIPAGAARWRETENGIKLERFAVLSDFRKKGIATRMLKQIMKEVLPLKKPIYLHAQMPVVKFYERRGFKSTGSPFFEAGIEHVVMTFEDI